MGEAPADLVRGDMGDLISAVAAYDRTSAAIGYTLYYYAHDMNMADGLKLLSIDGTAPCEETIRGGEYPFRNCYYTVIDAALPEDDPARILFDWFTGPEGQKLVTHEGYICMDTAGGAT